MTDQQSAAIALPLRVLVACEFSGVVRDAFRTLGHDATSCDLLPSEAPGPHIQDDVRNVGLYGGLLPSVWLASRSRGLAVSESAASGLLREFCDQADALVDALNARMKVRSAANITADELGDWIAKADGCAQALRDVRLLRRLGAHV